MSNEFDELPTSGPLDFDDAFLNMTCVAPEVPAVQIIRETDKLPMEPLQVSFSRSALQQMGWQTGDAITLVAVGPEPFRTEGKLIIRRALPGDTAFILDGKNHEPRAEVDEIISEETHDPDFAWCFPAEWVEAFLPGEYNPDYHHFHSETHRSWRLSDLRGLADQIELDASMLCLYLQRTKATPTSLDLHLPPELLRSRGWSSRTNLVLESATGFDPFTTEDSLTIRECCLGEEPNLFRAAGGLTVEVHPLWLDRFFPEVYDPSEDARSDHTSDHLGFHSENYSPLDYRDTLVVNYPEMISSRHALSFEIKTPRLK